MLYHNIWLLLVSFIILISESPLFSCTNSSNNPTSLPKFERAADSGIGWVGGFGQTAAWGDFNGDGCQDLFVANTDRKPPNLFLYKNNCDGTFVDITSESGISNVRVRSISWADFDNDGLLDLVISTIRAGAPPILYKNLDGNVFQNVSKEAGITAEGGVAWHTLWADYNRDGLVDLFQANSGSSYLYKNQGNGKFKEVSKEMGLGQIFNTRSAIWFDLNNDGFQDLFLANDGFNKLYLNNGGESFADITDGSGVKGDEAWSSVSVCEGDFNNDGFLDLYVGNIGSTRNALYLNKGDGTFEDITLKTGTQDIGDGRTCAWVDFDADGWLDLYTSNHVNPTKFFRNVGKGKFVNVANEVGLESPLDVFAASWGDYNNDNFIDTFITGHLGSGLMKNSGTTNKNLMIELKGDGILSNSSGIGTRVEVTTSKGTQIREVSGGRGCCEQDMLPVHFGVGNETKVDIRVGWTNGDACIFENIDVEVGRILSISQSDCEIVVS